VPLPGIVARRFARRKSLWESKTMTDEIIREVWRAKDELAKQFNYDIDALAAELQKRQQESGRKIVNLEKESVKQSASSHP
jgi:hypothetical protein